MNKNRLFVLPIALALLVLAMLTVESSIAASSVASSGKDLSDYALRHPGAAVERYFPGKEQDDRVTADVAIDRRFPGKEKDDIVAPMSALDRQFPGNLSMLINHARTYQRYQWRNRSGGTTTMAWGTGTSVSIRSAM